MSHVMKALLKIILENFLTCIQKRSSMKGMNYPAVLLVENFNTLRYADDIALLAESESTLQGIADVVRQNSEEKGLSINVKKTKTMVVCCDETPDVRIVVNGQVLEQVKVKISESMDYRQW